jgi:hypothetical protein
MLLALKSEIPGFLEKTWRKHVFMRFEPELWIVLQGRAEQTASQIDSVAVARGLACNQYADRVCTSVERLVGLVGGDFEAFACLKDKVLPVNFEGQDSVEDVEELSRVEMVVTTLTCAGRHELFDDAEACRLDQMPAVAVDSQIASPLVVVSGLCADDACRHRAAVPTLIRHELAVFEG